MAQSPKGGLDGPPYKTHLGGCAIYSETTVLRRRFQANWARVHPMCFLSADRTIIGAACSVPKVVGSPELLQDNHRTRMNLFHSLRGVPWLSAFAAFALKTHRLRMDAMVDQVAIRESNIIGGVVPDGLQPGCPGPPCPGRACGEKPKHQVQRWHLNMVLALGLWSLVALSILGPSLEGVEPSMTRVCTLKTLVFEGADP